MKSTTKRSEKGGSFHTCKGWVDGMNSSSILSQSILHQIHPMGWFSSFQGQTKITPVTTFPFHVVTHARTCRPAMPMHADSPRSCIPIWHITFTIIQPHTHAHLLHVPRHFHSFVHFHVYSDLILTSLQDRWLMPTHLKHSYQVISRLTAYAE